MNQPADKRPTVHVIGAGLAGLSTALRLSEGGVRVRLYEAAGQAGGRCRSFHDDKLGCLIDNGNHLLFSGNRSARRYLSDLGALVRFETAAEARFEFADLEARTRFAVRLDEGPVPTWIFDRRRRVPGASLAEHLAVFRLLLAGGDRSVAEAYAGRGAVWRAFVEPLTIAAINTVPEKASARLLRAVLLETFVKGGAHCRPMVARDGLGPALIDPALSELAGRGVPIAFNRSLRALGLEAGRVTALRFTGGDPVTLTARDQVVLAVPPARLKALLPDLAVPEGESAILNAHFRLAPELTRDRPSVLGVLGGDTQWIFTRPGLVSLTISAADALGLTGRDSEATTERLWSETRQALDLPPEAGYLGARLITEKRATFLQTPENERRRPAGRSPIPNLFLAGDATATGLPATIEGAIRSGETAARMAAAAAGSRPD